MGTAVDETVVDEALAVDETLTVVDEALAVAEDEDLALDFIVVEGLGPVLQVPKNE